jgi:hypothetical protein
MILFNYLPKFDLRTLNDTALVDPENKSIPLEAIKNIDFRGLGFQPKISFNSVGDFLQFRPSSSLHS